MQPYVMNVAFVVAVLVGLVIIFNVAKSLVRVAVIVMLVVFGFFMYVNEWNVQDSINDTKTTITNTGNIAVDKAKEFMK